MLDQSNYPESIRGTRRDCEPIAVAPAKFGFKLNLSIRQPDQQGPARGTEKLFGRRAQTTPGSRAKPGNFLPEAQERPMDSRQLTAYFSQTQFLRPNESAIRSNALPEATKAALYLAVELAG